MKHGTAILRVFCIIAILALIGWPTWRIYNTWQQKAETNYSAFMELRKEGINRLSTAGAIPSAEWQAKAGLAWLDRPGLLSIVISKAGQGVLFAMPSASHYYIEPSHPQASPSYSYPEKSVKLYSGSLSDGMILECLFTQLSQDEVFLPLRDMAIISLALILFTAGLLALPKGRRAALSHGSAVFIPADNAFNPDIPDLDEDYYDELASSIETEAVPASETSLGSRLEKEMAEGTGDISLLLASLEDSAGGERDFPILDGTISEFFKNDDRVFAFGGNGMAVILPELDTKRAVELGQEVHALVSRKLYEENDGFPGPDIYLGISSDMGRNASAEILIGEALSALKRAASEREGRIIAFSPDPEKYRAWLRAQTDSKV